MGEGTRVVFLAPSTAATTSAHARPHTQALDVLDTQSSVLMTALRDAFNSLAVASVVTVLSEDDTARASVTALQLAASFSKGRTVPVIHNKAVMVRAAQ